MPSDRNPKFTFAPTGYRPEWQSAPRRSHLPHDYFDRVPLWRRVERVVFWTLVAAVGLGFYFGG
jgi:hypothetical protein